MIKRLAREIIQMIIIALVMLLIALVTRYIGAGGRELVIARVIIVAMICIVISCILSLIVGKRA